MRRCFWCSRLRPVQDMRRSLGHWACLVPHCRERGKDRANAQRAYALAMTGDPAYVLKGSGAV